MWFRLFISVLACLPLAACKPDIEAVAKELLIASTSDKGACYYAGRGKSGALFADRQFNMFMDKTPMNPIFHAFRVSGLVSVKTEKRASDMSSLHMSNYYDILSFNDGLNVEDYWNPETKMLCAGKIEILEIVRYRFLGDASAENEAEVTYTWLLKMAKGVSPVRGDVFKGANGAIESTAHFRKYSDGWKHEE